MIFSKKKDEIKKLKEYYESELKRRDQRCIDDSRTIRTLDIIPGFNYSSGKWVRVHILARNNEP